MSISLCLQILKFIVYKNPNPRSKGISFYEINQYLNIDPGILRVHLDYLCDNLNGYLKHQIFEGMNYYNLTTLAVSCNLEGLKQLLETPPEVKTVDWLLNFGKIHAKEAELK